MVAYVHYPTITTGNTLIILCAISSAIKLIDLRHDSTGQRQDSDIQQLESNSQIQNSVRCEGRILQISLLPIPMVWMEVGSI